MYRDEVRQNARIKAAGELGNTAGIPRGSDKEITENLAKMAEQSSL